MSDTTQLSSIEEPTSPVLPVATAQEREALLWRLKARRRELIDAYAVGLGPDEPVSPSAVQPLAVVQAAIAAVEAGFAAEQWDADLDTFNTEAKPPGHDGEQCGDTDT